MGNDLVVETQARELPAVPLDLEAAKQELERVQQFIKDCMVEGTDYGPFPGNPDERFLYKPGAEKLANLYGLAPEPSFEDRTEQWDRVVPMQQLDSGVWVIDESRKVNIPLFAFTVKMELIQKRFLPERIVIAAAFGSCNSMEAVYRYRNLARECPDCGQAAIMPSKEEWGGGFYCNRQKGGCGHSWKHHPEGKPDQPIKKNEKIIADLKAQKVGQVLNTDIATVHNSVLKKAVTRALRAAVLMATRSSGLFVEPGDSDDEDESRKLARERQNGEGTGETEKRGSGGQQRSGGGRGRQSRGSSKAADKGDERPAGVPAHRTHKVVIDGKDHWSAGAEAAILVKIWKEGDKLKGNTKEKKAKLDALLRSIDKESTMDLSATEAQAFLLLVEKAVRDEAKA